MDENKKKKRFNDLLFKELNDSKYYDKLCYEFNRIRNNMIEYSPEFNNLSIDKQYHQCFAIWRMIVTGKRATMKMISLFNRNIDEDIKKYDIEYGYKPPEYIDVNGEQILMIE